MREAYQKYLRLCQLLPEQHHHVLKRTAFQGDNLDRKNQPTFAEPINEK